MLCAVGKYSVDGLLVNIIDERSALRSVFELPLEAAAGKTIDSEAPDLNSSRAAIRRAFALSRTQYTMLIPEKSDIRQDPNTMAAMLPFRFQAFLSALDVLVAVAVLVVVELVFVVELLDVEVEVVVDEVEVDEVVEDVEDDAVDVVDVDVVVDEVDVVDSDDVEVVLVVDVSDVVVSVVDVDSVSVVVSL